MVLVGCVEALFISNGERLFAFEVLAPVKEC
jgi:hypothetical protein